MKSVSITIYFKVDVKSSLYDVATKRAIKEAPFYFGKLYSNPDLLEQTLNGAAYQIVYRKEE